MSPVEFVLCFFTHPELSFHTGSLLWRPGTKPKFGWQIDRDFDNRVDCNVDFSSETSQKMEPRLKGCEKKWRKRKFRIKKRSGFYACVRDFSSNFIYPFKPDPHVGDTYIVARHRKLAVHDPPQNVIKESPILLDCAFEEPEPQWPYVVYWLKMSDVSERKISACVDFYSSEGQDRDQHCPIDPHLLGRISSTSPGPSGASEPQASEHPGHISHNVRIDRSRPGDSGIYLCVLNVQRTHRHEARRETQDQTETQDQRGKKQKDRGPWAVIRNITVTVNPIRKQTV
ncbi:uncharacterized protein LOC116217981 [Clupea harengus]|uniref:Uncharacterized protein LOC116217981 n=1 Tax=Clupea harengus TaxID=7950 RepID=A0A6P8ESP6_CLUHA|nr:uncharacterized protein LOC116217981 [Clupea harengus]